MSGACSAPDAAAGGTGGRGGGAGSGTGGAGGTQDAGPDAPACLENRQLCGTECVDTLGDPRHCGGCGRPCPVNQICVSSTCQVAGDCRQTPCAGFTYCDLANGQCKPGCALETQCAGNETCDIGAHACTCKEGLHRCSGACVSDTAPATCGALCTPCPTDPNGIATCNGTSCGITCNAGYQLCGGACAPCPTAGATAFACSGTDCIATACAAGAHLCGSQCGSNTSVTSCGPSSCTPCPTVPNGSATCNGTSCGITCNAGHWLCGSACTATLASRQVLANPGFDSGRTAWVEMTPANVIILTDASFTLKAQTPSYLAWLAGYDRAQDELYQMVTLPPEATSITLSFYYTIFTMESTAAANDFMYVSYQPVGGPPLVTLATFNDNMPTSTWTRFTLSLPASLAGQTFRLYFLATTNDSNATSFLVDSVSLDVNACPP